jgi:hypothetical protein
MGYSFNRASFSAIGTRIKSPHSLAELYCALVLLELSLKEHLGLINSPANRGHDLPTLLLRLGSTVAPHHKAACNQLSIRLGNQLSALWSQSGDGVPVRIPRSSYPYIRYFRHDSDWADRCSTTGDLESLSTAVARIHALLRSSLKVAI